MPGSSYCSGHPRVSDAKVSGMLYEGQEMGDLQSGAGVDFQIKTTTLI